MGTILKKIHRRLPVDDATQEAQARRGQETRRLWSQHFPKRKLDKISRTICQTLYLSIRSRALLNQPEKRLEEKVKRLLRQVGIPDEEFAQFEAEQKVANDAAAKALGRQR